MLPWLVSSLFTPSLYAPFRNPLDFSFACFLCYAQCCHGDGSSVKHVHIEYHGHSLYYQATILVIA